MENLDIIVLAAACSLLAGFIVAGWAYSTDLAAEVAYSAQVGNVATWGNPQCGEIKYEKVPAGESLASCHAACRAASYEHVGVWRENVCVCFNETAC